MRAKTGSVGHDALDERDLELPLQSKPELVWGLPGHRHVYEALFFVVHRCLFEVRICVVDRRNHLDTVLEGCMEVAPCATLAESMTTGRDAE